MSSNGKVISLTTIVKNEAEHLPLMIECFEPLVDEFCVIDTGSADGTLDIRHPKLRLQRSKEFTAETPRELFHFGRARNEALAMARGEWIFVTDPDHRLGPKEVRLLRAFFAGEKSDAFDVVLCDVLSGTEKTCHALFWRRSLKVRWQGAVHESVLPPKGCRAMHLDGIALDHIRCLAGLSPDERRARAEFNAAILERELAERPDDIHSLWCLGREYKNLGRHAEAIPLFQRVIETSGEMEGDEFLAWQMVFLAECYAAEGHVEATVKQLAAALDLVPRLAYAKYLLGHIYEQGGQLDEAELWYRRALLTPPPAGAFWIDAPDYRGKVTQQALDALRKKRLEAPRGTN